MPTSGRNSAIVTFLRIIVKNTPRHGTEGQKMKKERTIDALIGLFGLIGLFAHRAHLYVAPLPWHGQLLFAPRPQYPAQISLCHLLALKSAQHRVSLFGREPLGQSLKSRLVVRAAFARRARVFLRRHRILNLIVKKRHRILHHVIGKHRKTRQNLLVLAHLFGHLDPLRFVFCQHRFHLWHTLLFQHL